MSTLTKVLIILLTVTSIFLCGIVVSYVGNATDYKELYETERNRKRDADNKRLAAENEFNVAKENFKKAEDDLKQKVATLTSELNRLKSEIKTANTKKTDLEQKVQSWVTITDDLAKTNADQLRLLQQTLDELKQLNIRQTEQSQRLEETTTTLIAKMAIIDTLERDKRRLEEERTQLQDQLNQVLRQFGKEAPPLRVVTREPAVAAPVAPPVPAAPEFAKEIGLKGAITGVDLNNKVAQISIGAVNDVRKDMKFYVTRGDEFVCELVIFYVDNEAAVGKLQNIVYQPQAGDSVSTNI